MQIVKIQFCHWDKIYDFSNENNLDLQIGNKVIVETDVGTDIGTVVAIKEAGDNYKEEELKPVVRLIDKNDLSKITSKTDRADMIQYCRSLVKKHNLPMKIIDVHCFYDNSRIKFAFIADGRVDFRELVKDLIRHYQKSVILYQVGIRDEAKIGGDIGRCGVRPMCCRGFLKELGGISADMAETQQIAHRGSERLSGICGRLMCCLQFEEQGYEELARELPPIGSKVIYEGVEAEVVGWHTLKKTVDLKIRNKENESEMLFDISLEKLKKLNKN